MPQPILWREHKNDHLAGQNDRIQLQILQSFNVYTASNSPYDE